MVDRVYLELEKKGLIRREAKRGVFVAEAKPVRAPLLGLVSPSVQLKHPYYLQIQNGIEEAAHEQGAEIMLISEATRFPEWGKTDGIIFTNPRQWKETPCRMCPV